MDAVTPTPAMMTMRRSLLITSPKYSVWHTYWKETACAQRFMPLWDVNEMISYAKVCCPDVSDEVVREHYRIFGGTVRKLGKDTEFVKNAMKSAVGDHTLADAHVVDYNARYDVSHNLFHIDCASDFTVRRVIFASPFVEKLVTDRYTLVNYGKVRRFVSLESTKTEEMRVRVFEEVAHYAFQKGGTFKVKKLKEAKEKEENKVEEWTIHVGNREDIDRIKTPGEDYYVPLSLKWPSFDSYTKKFMFQMTISASHEVNVTEIVELCEADKEMRRARFVFVVPDWIFSQWKSRQILKGKRIPKYVQSMEQWVLRFPVEVM